ncbi:hypothetical protein ACFO3U_00415 [Flavobacterium ponti]|uniref:DUF1129 family protein n=1 Tax=Flavobacterium ponti TaxID=665133 RepID=A0ABV9NYL7_9FLAO
MKITKQNIQFIDNYLKRNNVIYYDIRMEMLDHILNGIENEMKEKNIGFYDAFKIYMPVHKAEILKANKQSLIDGTSPFLKSLTNSYNLFVAIFTILLCTIFKENIIALNSVFWILMLLYLIIRTLIYFINSRKRYFVLEKSGFILNFIYFINLILNGFGNSFFGEFHGKIYTVGLVIFLSISFFIYYINTIIKFNKSNKMLLAK